MGRIKMSIKSYLNTRLLSVASLVISMVLVILELLLLPWGEIKKVIDVTLSSSMMLLSIMCVVSVVVSVVVAIATIICTDRKLRKEKERLNTTWAYIKLISDVEKEDSHTKLMEDLMRGENITRQEYIALQELYMVATNKEDGETCEITVNHTIDKVAATLDKITNNSL